MHNGPCKIFNTINSLNENKRSPFYKIYEISQQIIQDGKVTRELDRYWETGMIAKYIKHTLYTFIFQYAINLVDECFFSVCVCDMRTLQLNNNKMTSMTGIANN